MLERTKLTKMARLMGVFSSLMSIVWLINILLISDSPELLQAIKHFMLVIYFATIGIWGFSYADFRDNYIYKNLYSEIKRMKTISLIAAFVSLCYFFVTLLRFLELTTINYITVAYVICEMVLALVFAMFFFVFWNEKRKNIDDIDD